MNKMFGTTARLPEVRPWGVNPIKKLCQQTPWFDRGEPYGPWCTTMARGLGV